MIYGTNFFYGRITGIRSGQMSNLAQLPTDINYTAKEKNNLYYTDKKIYLFLPSSICHTHNEYHSIFVLFLI